MTPVLTGSEDFLLRGNVVELAVAVVIGAAFTALVERRARGEEPGPAQPTQVELLAEIRELLRAQQIGLVQVRPRPEARRELASGEEDGGPLQGPAASLRVVEGRRVLAQSLPQCGGRSSR